MKGTDISLLLSLPLFRGMKQEDLSQFLSDNVYSLSSYPKNSIPIMAGDVIHSIGIVLEGILIGQVDNQNGTSTIINYLEKGSVFGDVLSGSGDSSPVTVYAKTNCRILWLDLNGILNTIHTDKVYVLFLKNLIQEISEKFFTLNDRVQILSERKLRDRIFKMLNIMAVKQGSYSITLPYKTRYDLANYLGSERASLSRELSKMSREGLIKIKKNKVELMY